MSLDKWNDAIVAVRELTGLLGAIGVISLVAILLVAALLFFFMILRFGEKGAEMIIPFLRESFAALLREPSKSHPAIRLELRLHVFFGAILAACLGASILHALFPWVREGVEHLIVEGFVASLIVSICLAIVSIGLSLRL